MTRRRPVRFAWLFGAGALGVLVAILAAATGTRTTPALASTCSDYSSQAAAQRAADTRDGDGDGVYCEDNPCPCLTGGGPGPPVPTTASPPTNTQATTTTTAGSCVRPGGVANITFSKTRYPNIRRHFLRALRKGWPRILVVNRAGADSRRDRLLAGVPTVSGMDRDEYPPAVGRSRWRGDVSYVPSSENRSHGATMGIKLRRFCDGTRFRYVFY